MFTDEEIITYNSLNTIVIDKLYKKLLDNNILVEKKYTSSMYTYFDRSNINQVTLHLVNSKYDNTFIDFNIYDFETGVYLCLCNFNKCTLSETFRVRFNSVNDIDYDQCVKAIEFYFDLKFTPVQLSMFDMI